MHSGSPTILHEIAIKMNGRAAKCASIFTWATEGAKIPAVIVSEAAGIWTLRSESSAFAIDMKKRVVALT
jgi:hypothetical protein